MVPSGFIAICFSVSLSSDIAPEPREFERSSTTVANAFVAPVMSLYLTSLETSLLRAGASGLRVMQSNGGALSPREAASLMEQLFSIGDGSPKTLAALERARAEIEFGEFALA